MEKDSLVIYLDMDGVCCDFYTAAITLHGKKPEEVYEYWQAEWEGEFHLYKVLGLECDAFWNPIHEAKEKFWFDLSSYLWFEELYRALSHRAKVIFLSSGTWEPYCLAGKLQWLQKRFGRDFQDYIFTSRKHCAASAESLLIDDHEDNTQGFEHFCGSSVLFPQLWNKNFGLTERRIEFTLETVDLWLNSKGQQIHGGQPQ